MFPGTSSRIPPESQINSWISPDIPQFFYFLGNSSRFFWLFQEFIRIPLGILTYVYPLCLIIFFNRYSFRDSFWKCSRITLFFFPENRLEMLWTDFPISSLKNISSKPGKSSTRDFTESFLRSSAMNFSRVCSFYFIRNLSWIPWDIPPAFF